MVHIFHELSQDTFLHTDLKSAQTQINFSSDFISREIFVTSPYNMILGNIACEPLCFSFEHLTPRGN